LLRGVLTSCAHEQDLQKLHWDAVVARGGRQPVARQDHAHCSHNNMLVVHGGVAADGRVLDDMFALHAGAFVPHFARIADCRCAERPVLCLRRTESGVWTYINQEGDYPGCRTQHSLTACQWRGTAFLALFGGRDESDALCPPDLFLFNTGASFLSPYCVPRTVFLCFAVAQSQVAGCVCRCHSRARRAPRSRHPLLRPATAALRL
jgi:hypothetical protein